MFFPYLFCKESNKEAALNTLPPFEDYLPDGKKPEVYETFKRWYDDNYNTPFCLKTALAEYCENDTLILLEAVLAMRRILRNITKGYDVLPKARSIAGVAIEVYNKCFLQPDTISIIPDGGYEKCDKASDKALKMMNWIAKTRNIDVQHAGNGREFQIDRYKVDGYIESQKKVLEFMGCYYHSHPLCTDPEEPAPNGKLHRINYKDTTRRLNEIKKQGFDVEVFWECQVDEMMKHNQEMKNFFQDCEPQGCIGIFFIILHLFKTLFRP